MSKSNSENDSDLSREEKLRMENEIEKLKLSAFHDAKFSESSEDLPPEIENEWLKYIAHFEKEWEDVERIKIVEKLDNPDYPAVEDLSGSEIEEKLDEVQQQMAEQGIFLDAICEVPDAEIYRFIIEELFEHEIDDVDIEGMQTVFIYEEFYPNDELDIEQTIEDFMLQLFDPRFHDDLHINVSDTCETAAGAPISGEAAVEKAIAFASLYDQLELETIHNLKFNIDEVNGKALISFDIAYHGQTDADETLFEGEATAKMAKGKLGYWNIVMLNIPGFAF